MSIELIGGDVQAEAIIALQILNDTNRGLLICTIRYEYPENLHFTSVTITANGKEYVFDNVLASYSESRKANHISPYLHGPSCDIIGALLNTNTEVHYVLHGDKTIEGRMEIINYKSQLQSLYDDYIANGGKSQDLSEFAKE